MWGDYHLLIIEELNPEVSWTITLGRTVRRAKRNKGGSARGLHNAVVLVMLSRHILGSMERHLMCTHRPH